MPTPTIEVKPSKLNFAVRRGSTLRRTVTWYSIPVWLDAEETELDTGASIPVDLTGYTARMQVRGCRGEGLVFELTTENGGLTLGGVAGTIVFFISDTETESTEVDKSIYDLELIEPSGDVVPFLSGTFTLQDQVTV